MKKKIDLPKRSNDIYKEIEGFREDNSIGFQEYEYTNCIAYEMAIRNKDFLNLSKKINKDFLNFIEFEQELEFFGFELSNFPYPLANMLKIDTEIPGKIISAIRLKNKIDALNIIFNYAISNNLIYKIDLENEQCKKVKLTIKALTEKYKHPLDSIMYAIKMGKAYIPLKGIPNTIINTFDKELIELLDLKSFDVNAGIIYSRPKLINSFKKEIKIELNLALPLDELIAYVSKIKNEYDKDNSIVKNPLELLGEDLNKADENLLIHKGTGKYNKYRVADMFFIYDGMKKGMKKAKIINELNYYYYDKDNKNTNFTYDTLNTYYEKAIELIDNLKYKELITGVKITN
ncbi:hypothetical protein [Arcobacter defluvii]|uniref:Uncharacterized protein n=1 Tax=Arcobacter defluvii TaxID=873191 RepID=A0AAE7E696_9BACT|nr:hypothetical protein [Arcobacter defluvii]QKF77152.1 hypothetical protein ADFLV_1118 [Arcobacter defluvii]RXI33556.1 hypothetical protein CP964_06070 [Arcobacter defluvii]